MANSKIEWTEKTWNPIVSGCSIISEGCSNCYAMKMAHRLEAMGQEKYKGLTKKTASGNIVWNGKINIDMNDKALYEPLKTKKPTMYFVNSMTDLFHEDVPFEAIDKIMAVIALSPQHTFQVLTKRADRMKEYFESKRNLRQEVFDLIYENKVYHCPKDFAIQNYEKDNYILPNLWLGVSVETQEQADTRITALLRTPAKVRFLSCEPLLEYVNLAGFDGKVFRPFLDRISQYQNKLCGTGIDWVIVGGESGKKARPMHPDWVRSIQQQCQQAGVPFFFKQWGEYAPIGQQLAEIAKGYIFIEDKKRSGYFKLGKHKAGRLLDGVEYNEMPIF